jgi:hypothetical protein
VANSNVFKVPATSLVTASVTLQTAAHGSITYLANSFFMGVGGNVQTLERQIEILDAIEWLVTRAMPVNGTPLFPRPGNNPGLTALETEMLYANWGVKHAWTLVSQATISDPFAADNSVFFGLTGSNGTPPKVNYGAALGSVGLKSAFEAMKKFSLTPEGKIWT